MKNLRHYALGVKPFLLAGALLGCTAAQATTTWDLAADYPTATAASAWSFGTFAGSSFDPYDTVNSSGNYDRQQNWNGSSMWMNNTGTTGYGVAPGQVSVHPGQGWEAATVRWTAPSAGMADIAATFYTGDWGVLDYHVYLNGTALWNSNDNSQNATFASQLTLQSGDQLDFSVDGGWAYGNTPLAISVALTAPVPEPETYAMLLAGLGLVGGIARRRQARKAA